MATLARLRTKLNAAKLASTSRGRPFSSILCSETFAAFRTPSTRGMATFFDPVERFADRHIGLSAEDKEEVRASLAWVSLVVFARSMSHAMCLPLQMLKEIGCDSMDQLVQETVPEEIMMARPLALDGGRSEMEMLVRLSDTHAPPCSCSSWRRCRHRIHCSSCFVVHLDFRPS